MKNLIAHSQSYSEALLYDYAMGTLDESQSLIMATYLTLSPQARQYMKLCENIGGAILEEIADPVALAPAAFDRVMQRLQNTQLQTNPLDKADAQAIEWQGLSVPQPLKPYLHSHDVRFKTVFHGLDVAQIPTRCKKSQAQLMRLAPRTAVLDHTHEGLEINLVLKGAFHDEYGVYKSGDLIITDGQIQHCPVSDEIEGCVCLVVTTAPLRLTGWVGRFLNPFIRR